jgi:hypothetical protein
MHVWDNDEACEPARAKKAKKTFIIEWKYVGPLWTWYSRASEWRTYKKYRTEADMMKGFQAAVSQAKNSPYVHVRQWKYRIA